jgi:hypothetical protein
VTAQILLDRGSWVEVVRAADELRSGVLANGWRLWEPLGPLLIGRAHLATGDLARARPEFDLAVTSARSAGATGTLPLARAFRDQVLILAGRKPRSTMQMDAGTSAELAAVLAENRGLLQIGSRRDLLGASSAFEAATDLWRQLGLTSALARAYALHAEAERRSGNRRKAGQLSGSAARVLDTLRTPGSGRGSLLRPLEALNSR